MEKRWLGSQGLSAVGGWHGRQKCAQGLSWIITCSVFGSLLRLWGIIFDWTGEGASQLVQREQRFLEVNFWVKITCAFWSAQVVKATHMNMVQHAPTTVVTVLWIWPYYLMDCRLPSLKVQEPSQLSPFPWWHSLLPWVTVTIFKGRSSLPLFRWRTTEVL